MQRKALSQDFCVNFFLGLPVLQMLSTFMSQSPVQDFGGPYQTTHIRILAEYSGREGEREK